MDGVEPNTEPQFMGTAEMSDRVFKSGQAGMLDDARRHISASLSMKNNVGKVL